MSNQQASGNASDRASGEQTRYEVHLSDEHWAEVRGWDDHLVNTLMDFIRDHASRTPTTRIRGRLKMLKGAYHGYYQFRVDRRRRFIYSVDEVQRLVIAEYVGLHPDWRKSRRRGRITR